MAQDIATLFDVHQKISEEIGQAKLVLGTHSRFKDGHINGLEEANNQIEELICDAIKDKEEENNQNEKFLKEDISETL